MGRSVFNSLRCVGRCERGTGSIEFALCFPILLAIYFLGYTYWQAHRAKENLGYASTVAVDLVTRATTVSDGSMDRIIEVTRSLAKISDTNDSFIITFASVHNPIDGDDQNSDIEIDWTYSNKSTAQMTVDEMRALTLPTIAPGDSVIVSTLSVSYTLPFVPDDLRDIDFEQTAVRRPRFVNRVEFNES